MPVPGDRPEGHARRLTYQTRTCPFPRAILILRGCRPTLDARDGGTKRKAELRQRDMGYRL